MTRRRSQKDYNMLQSHGLTSAQYNKMLDNQPHCYICGKHTTELIKGLCLDHNHETGTLRKFLCPRCNMLVGIHEQDSKLLTQIRAYVLEHEE